ncbi:MAG: hypothetical protein J0M17_23830, partial [Planctomycetes bacterium]|nr:hypothetical protein [Planctomycetota bacterium]
MKISRFLLVAGAVTGLLAGTVYFLRPERWFGDAAVAAVVEVRVVPRFAPTAESVRNEFVLKVTGKVRRRPAGTENPNLASGEIEILCHDLEV